MSPVQGTQVSVTNALILRLSLMVLGARILVGEKGLKQ